MRSLFALTLFVASLACRQSSGGDVAVEYGVAYADREAGPLKADVYLPKGDGPFPGVLVVHGGAWRMGSRAQLAGPARLLAEHGYVAAAISYRLAPEYKFPAQIDDCKAAVRWLRKTAERWRLDPEHVGGFGYSAGAQLVALLGATDPHDGLEGLAKPAGEPSTRLQAVVAGGAPCEFRTIRPDVHFLDFWLGGSPAEKPEQYRLASPRAFVTPDDPPMFFYHGSEDRLVPPISAEAMCRSLQAAGVEHELYMIPKVGHTAASLDRQAVERAIAFLDRHLKPQGATP
jgi:acetyl esterase/lipase